MPTETIVILETTLDDCSPQVIGYVLERALALGALDAYTTPAAMKKGRPGVVVSLLARPEARDLLCELLLAETTTLGVRVQACERVVRERHCEEVATVYGRITVKVAGNKAMPEYEQCRAAALRHAVPLAVVQETALAAWRAAAPVK